MKTLECSEIDTDSIFKVLDKFIEISHSLFVDGALNNEFTVIEQIANAKKLVSTAHELADTIKSISSKALVCYIINAYELDKYLEQAEQELTEYLSTFEVLENAMEADIDLDAIIESDDPDQAINERIDLVFSGFMGEMEKQLTELKGKVREALSILEYLGSTPVEIDKAIEDVEYQDNLKDYIINIFKSLAYSSLERLD